MSFSTILARLASDESGLRSLNLSSSKLGDEDARKLATALQRDIVLTAADLTNNAITDVGVRALSAALQTNQTLTVLNLTGNQVSQEALQPLTLALQRNRKIMVPWAKAGIANNQFLGAIKI